MDLDKLISDLKRDEGIKPLLYDDHNGKPLKTGSVIVGNPTIGIGWNVASTPLTTDQYVTILGWQVADKIADLKDAFPWFNTLPEPIQRAMTNMCFNMGLATLENFTTFLSLIQAGKWNEAADDLETTKWHQQVGERAERIEALIRSA